MRIRVCVIAFCIFLAACAQTAAHRSESANANSQWTRTELFFGISAIDAEPAVVAERESRWRAFLDREVTPRFPDGLSVYDVSGQWRSPARDVISHEHSKSVLILYRDSPQHRADIEAIRNAWKKLTSDESVLRVTQSVDVSF
jgi:broad specificity phosphatase PhoE